MFQKAPSGAFFRVQTRRRRFRRRRSCEGAIFSCRNIRRGEHVGGAEVKLGVRKKNGLCFAPVEILSNFGT